MKELSIEEKARLYDEKIEMAKKWRNAPNANKIPTYANRIVEELFPELKNDDERIRKAILELVHDTTGDSLWVDYNVHKENALAWLEKRGQTFTKKDVDDAYLKGISDTKNELEKQGEQNLANSAKTCKDEQKPAMIQWKGDNLKDVVDFTGVYKEGFEKWFHNSWEEYEKYVHEHNNIFKIFNEDGSHMEVPVGAWIIKAPDGYNTASRFAISPILTEISIESNFKFKKAIECIENYVNSFPHSQRLEIWQHINFLKSLKPQSQWKPSDEQMGVIEAVINNRSFQRRHLDSLYNDLKKLKG